MSAKKLILALVGVFAPLASLAQVPGQIQLNISTTNRTLTVRAEERVTAEPDLAILHIGFMTPVSDAKTAYSAGAATSNQIVSALKKAGIPDGAIRSESQGLQSIDAKAHKFRLSQEWVVRVEPQRAAEVLDIAINAGATQSGDIEWNVNDEKALEDKALKAASERARSDAAVLAAGMGLKLGAIVYVTNQIVTENGFGYATKNFSRIREVPSVAPLAIEAHKVSRTATVYAVFAIE